MKQCAAWDRAGVTIIPRTLRYPYGWPNAGRSAQEKGIDVALSIDFVTMAIENRYDVGILASADTDMIPALEYVARQTNPDYKKIVETAGWISERHGSRLRVPRLSIWHHKLDLVKYNYLADAADYTM